MNAKSGVCPEDCGYCSQSVVSTAPSRSTRSSRRRSSSRAHARPGRARRARTASSPAAAGRAPGAARGDGRRARHQGGAADEDLRLPRPAHRRAGGRARDAGVDRYNHNLNTSADHYGAITTTHTYEDRVHTIEAVKRAGSRRARGSSSGWARRTSRSSTSPSPCASSTPTRSRSTSSTRSRGRRSRGLDELDPRRCLKVFCLVPLVCPSKEIRVSGGREVNLRSLQPLALYPANAIFLGDYLTTPGQTADGRLPDDRGPRLRDRGMRPLEGSRCETDGWQAELERRLALLGRAIVRRLACGRPSIAPSSAIVVA